ncbi:MAG: phytanoyl-CoA dioxygenase family protein [Ferruginibacter sp.]
MFNTADFKNDILTQGYCIVENVLSPEFVAKAKAELEIAIEKEVAYHKTNEFSDFGMVLLCSLYGGAFVELFDNKKLNDAFNVVLGDGCIVYAYTSSSMPPQKTNYSARIHVDCPRLITDYITNMGATILLDDFTEENGATWFLPFSQTMPEKPADEEFYKNGKRVIAKAGSVWFFNARIWHAGGNNLTDQWRHALTINMCRPFMKQRIDIPRAMQDMDLGGVSQQALQKLGFLAQVPASYDEYYTSPEKRKFKQAAE